MLNAALKKRKKSHERLNETSVTVKVTFGIEIIVNCDISQKRKNVTDSKQLIQKMKIFTNPKL